MPTFNIESECACDTCKAMCKRMSCIATPQDVEKLIAAGYKDKLEIRVYYDEKTLVHFPLIAPKFSKETGCVFHNDQGLCELHDKKLKPTEGRVANHALVQPRLSASIAFTWCRGNGEEVMAQFEDSENEVKMIRIIKANITK